jgi:hypothetical protein
LIDREPVVLLRPVEIDDLRLGAGNRHVRLGGFDIDAVDENVMERAAADGRVCHLRLPHLAVNIEDRRRR